MKGKEASKRLYTIKEACAYLGRSEWGLREMLYDGKIPFIKDGSGRRGRVFIDIRDMDEWIEKNKTRQSF